MIKVGNITEMSEDYRKNIMIVRTVESMPEYAIQMTELSPSTELFKKYRQVYHSGEFNKKWFDEVYVPQFIRELCENPKAVSRLRDLCVDSKVYSVFLCCYCENEEICHRSIIAGILLGMGSEIKTERKYLKYFTMFLEEMKRICDNEKR